MYIYMHQILINCNRYFSYDDHDHDRKLELQFMCSTGIVHVSTSAGNEAQELNRNYLLQSEHEDHTYNEMQR